MEKTLVLVIASAVITMTALIIIPSFTETLENTGETKDQLQKNTACEVQTREAQRSDNPSMVEDRCLDYIDDAGFKAEAESAEVSCILSGNC
ncbi:hypothetical protein ACK3SF_05555 [Candidatus Nanosalina sp. VS9-1]|uniref:hypothetical protein n=1 Tax=Candidatus Nanosalina sp. VS9-1 TaxID=3388566 RepID=UPI0039DFD21B